MVNQPVYYDLSYSQEILLLSQRFNLFKQVNNIFSLMLIDKPLDFRLLRQAIQDSCQNCDAMRLRLTKDKGKIRQHFLAADPPMIGLLDFSGRTSEAMDRELHRLARIPITRLNRPLHRVWLVCSPEGLQGIYLGVSHMAMDSWAICMLMKHIMENYEAMVSGKAQPPPMLPYEDLLAGDLAYRQSPQHDKDREFWHNELTKSEPIFTHVIGASWLDNARRRKRDPNRRTATCYTLDTRARHEVIIIPAAQVARMEAYCRDRRVPMQTLFMLGLRTALSARNRRQPDITLHNAVARRGTLQEKNSGGSRVHALLFRTIIDEQSTFADALQQIAQHQNNLFRHANYSLLDVFAELVAAYTPGDRLGGSYAGLTLTFQPFRIALADGTIIKTRWYCNGVASQPLYLTVMDGDGTGALRCYYEYQIKVFTPSIVQAFHREAIDVIEAGLADDQCLIGALLDRISVNSHA